MFVFALKLAAFEYLYTFFFYFQEPYICTTDCQVESNMCQIQNLADNYNSSFFHEQPFGVMKGFSS